MAVYKITAPDGSVYNITAPEGASDADLYAAAAVQHAASPQSQPVQHTGYAAQVARTLAGNGPSTSVPVPTGTQLMQDWGDLGKGAAIGALSAAPGLFGDTEAVGRSILSKFTNVSPATTWFPTSGDIGNDIAGAPTSGYDAGGRMLGNLFGPTLALGGIDALSALRAARLASDPLAQAASNARAAGYVLPPNMASNSPGVVSQVLSGVGGRVKTQQLASVKNADVTNALVARSLGLTEDQPLTEAALEQVRRDAGTAYDAVKQAPIQVIPDAQFQSDVAGLNQAGAEARAEFPELVGNSGIDNLVDTLSAKQQMSPAAAVDLIRSLRYKAQTNLKNYTSPETLDLGRAQSQAANALETLIERNLQAAETARAPIGAQGGGMSQLVANLQKARATIAKSYNIQDALNPVTGNVDAQKLAALSAKGAPMTGELAQIADTATAFPKAVQNLAKFGGNENLSVLDTAGTLGAAALGRPEVMGWLLGRPLARSVMLSNLYQSRVIPMIDAAGNAAIPRLLTPRNAAILTAPGVLNNISNILALQAQPQ